MGRGSEDPGPPADHGFFARWLPTVFYMGKRNAAEPSEGGFWILCDTSGIFYGSTEDRTPGTGGSERDGRGCGAALLLDPPPLRTAAAQ